MRAIDRGNNRVWFSKDFPNRQAISARTSPFTSTAGSCRAASAIAQTARMKTQTASCSARITRAPRFARERTNRGYSYFSSLRSNISLNKSSAGGGSIQEQDRPPRSQVINKKKILPFKTDSPPSPGFSRTGGDAGISTGSSWRACQ